ncbi:MAG: DUF4124 domain-containing protein [Nitrospinae bacterium]|nr:DUF4124 domain-containing protein [Nitrospinota bacterium]
MAHVIPSCLTLAVAIAGKVFSIRRSSAAGSLAFVFVMLYASPGMCGDFYQWTDENGETHFSDSLAGVPAKHRGKLKTGAFPAPKPQSSAPVESAQPASTAQAAPEEPNVSAAKSQPVGGSVMSVTDFDFAAKINGDKPALVYFWAAWCKVCRRTDSVFNDVAGEHGGKTAMLKLDVDVSPKTSRSFGIKGVPTFILFQSGKEVGREVGGLSKNHLVKLIGATAQAR